ncbi:uncharacterized protein VP01_1159g6 [Puccinia sorghi]|uniref:GAG-pre-integrase domain-containing protein n=1 Tax=Puccinia sorghi TaxID=27349 RepID=A0A0L6VRQ8_9BASI|nr:uncharacterized protein VP01_1159g6 [Puccinia sorghi]
MEGDSLDLTLVGKLKIENHTGSITINNVYYSPDASCTLLSAFSLHLGGGNVQVNSEGNASVHFDNGFYIQSLCIHCCWQIPALVLPGYPPAVFVPPAKPINPLKSIEGCDKSLTILSASVKQSDALMWHRRLGHVSLKRIIKMCVAGNLPGLPDKLTNKDFVCKDCLLSKSKRTWGMRFLEDHILQPMYIIVSDVLGPFAEGFSGVQYLVVFRDLSSTYSEGFLLKAKKDVCLTFKWYIE